MTVSFAFACPFDPRDYQGFIRHVGLAEDAGFDMVLAGDSPAIVGDLYVGLTLIAQNTTRCRIGASVTNPVSRHPAVAAAAAASVDELSDGRLILGISTGDSGVYGLGRRASTQSHLAEYVSALRGLWRHGTSTYQGTSLRMPWPRRDIPVYLAPGGPRGLRLAGQIADGVLVETGLTSDIVKDSLDRLEAGARETGRGLDDIDVWWFVKANLAESREQAAHELRSGLASSANHTFRFGLDGKFVPQSLHEAIRRLQSAYVYTQHVQPGDHVRNAQLVDELGLTDYLLDRFAIVGTPQDWIERIGDLVERGVRQIVIPGIMADRDRFLVDFATHIAPAFLGKGRP